MRLINVKTHQLEEFFGDKIPAYCILSHTWGEEEVTYSDLAGTAKPGSKPYTKKAGYQKINFAKDQTLKDGHEYLWVDTCCIDKSSSAELSEAINSMYKWYEQSLMCYAYLQDVSSETDLEKSRWFTRGWTLQELIAPITVHLFGSGWWRIGYKNDLAGPISRTTGIPKTVFYRYYGLSAYSVACRMSWAAKRQTTRTEDRAYSLLGIFGVTMPLLYGEGNAAFQRLEQEIWKSSRDHSLFASRIAPRYSDIPIDAGSILADDPSDFEGSEDVMPFPYNTDSSLNLITSRGIQLVLPLIPDSRDPPPSSSPGRRVLAILDCQDQRQKSTVLALPLLQAGPRDTYMRLWGFGGTPFHIPIENVVDKPLQKVYLSLERVPLLWHLQSGYSPIVHVVSDTLQSHGLNVGRVFADTPLQPLELDPETQTVIFSGKGLMCVELTHSLVEGPCVLVVLSLSGSSTGEVCGIRAISGQDKASYFLVNGGLDLSKTTSRTREDSVSAWVPHDDESVSLVRITASLKERMGFDQRVFVLILKSVVVEHRKSRTFQNR